MNGKIGLKEVRNLSLNQTIWDKATPGFGIRRQQSSAVSYILKYRTKSGRQRWLTIGRHGAPWTPEMARQEAIKILGSVVTGADPASSKGELRHGVTVSKLCDQYLADVESGRLLTRRKIAKKASTIATDRGRIVRHIKPILGTYKVASIARADIEAFMHAVASGVTASRTKSDKKRGLSIVKGGKGTATRTVGLLGAIFSYAVRAGMRTDNPVHGVVRFADGRRDRRLKDGEYKLIESAVQKAGDAKCWPPAIAAIKFLLFSGWRSGEVLALKWDDIDLDRKTARLRDTKTGRSVRPLSDHLCQTVNQLPRLTEYVFPAARGSGRMVGFPKIWARVMKAEHVPKDITPHILRHSFASLASDMGYSDATISALIGHKGATVTSRYIHNADAALIAASDRIARRIDALSTGVVLNLRSQHGKNLL